MGRWAEERKDDPRHPRWEQQRRDRGFDDPHIWGLDHTIAERIYPRLRALAAHHCGRPPTLTSEEWTAIVHKMADGFEEYATKQLKADWDKVNEGRDLFHEWYYYLWT